MRSKSLITWDGIWLFLLFLAVKTLSHLVGYIMGQTLEYGNEPEKLLLYYVRWDLIQGLCDSAALLFMVAVGGLAFERYRRNALLLILFAVVWNTITVWKMIVILYECDYVMHPTLAVVGWASLTEYNGDPSIRVGFLAIMVLIASFSIFWAIRENKRKAAISASGPNPGNPE